MDYNEVLEMVNRIVDDRIEAAIDSARQEWEQYTDQVRREIEERIDDLE